MAILAEHGETGATAAEFAAKAFSRSKHWRTPVRAGSAPTGTVVRSAGAQLGKLRSMGYAEQLSSGAWRCSDAGAALLRGEASGPAAAPHGPASFAPGWVQYMGAWCWRDAAGGLSWRDPQGRLFLLGAGGWQRAG